MEEAINYCSEHQYPFCRNNKCTYDNGCILLQGLAGYLLGVAELKRQQGDKGGEKVLVQGATVTP